MIDFSLAEETLGYVSASDPSNMDKRLLIAGSKNVIIDQQRKVEIRNGTTRLGVANPALTPTLNAWKWDTSTGTHLSQKNYNGGLYVYLTSVDNVVVNDFNLVGSGFSTTKRIVPALAQVLTGGGWYDSAESIDIQVMANGDTNLYEWSGGVAAAASTGTNTLTKGGTTTWGQNRFYTTRNKVVTNIRTGVDFTYTGGEGTQTLIGVTPDPAGADIVAGDIFVQKIVTHTNAPDATHINDIVFVFQNQIVTGSKTNPNSYISKNSSITDFTYSTPRISGEGGLLTLDGPTRAINSLGTYLLVFAGKSSIFRADYTQITVSTTLAETLNVKKFDVGINQGALNHESVVPMGNQLAYLTCETTLRTIDNVQNISGIDPKRYSNPIKPDFDAETWDPDNTFGTWYKNALMYAAGATSRMYILTFNETAQGQITRYWNPPQTLPVGPLSFIDLQDGNGERLFGHSTSTPETYLLFDGNSDGQYANMNVSDKVAIHAIAKYAYNNNGKRDLLKTFNLYAVNGEISANTKLNMLLLYNYDGYDQVIQEVIDGSDEDILEGVFDNNSLAQSEQAQQPLGGLVNPPANARRYRVNFEEAREDYFELSPVFETNDVDQYWSVIAHGPNATLSPRRAITINK